MLQNRINILYKNRIKDILFKIIENFKEENDNFECSFKYEHPNDPYQILSNLEINVRDSNISNVEQLHRYHLVIFEYADSIKCYFSVSKLPKEKKWKTFYSIYDSFINGKAGKFQLNEILTFQHEFEFDSTKFSFLEFMKKSLSLSQEEKEKLEQFCMLLYLKENIHFLL